MKNNCYVGNKAKERTLVFRKVSHTLFSCNHRSQICPFALLPMKSANKFESNDKWRGKNGQNESLLKITKLPAHCLKLLNLYVNLLECSRICWNVRGFPDLFVVFPNETPMGPRRKRQKYVFHFKQILLKS